MNSEMAYWSMSDHNSPLVYYVHCCKVNFFYITYSLMLALSLTEPCYFVLHFQERHCICFSKRTAKGSTNSKQSSVMKRKYLNIIQYHLALTQFFTVLGKSQYCICKYTDS